jgi:hypothetical protein
MSCLSFAIRIGLFKFYGPYSYGVMTGELGVVRLF